MANVKFSATNGLSLSKLIATGLPIPINSQRNVLFFDGQVCICYVCPENNEDKGYLKFFGTKTEISSGSLMGGSFYYTLDWFFTKQQPENVILQTCLQ